MQHQKLKTKLNGAASFLRFPAMVDAGLSAASFFGCFRQEWYRLPSQLANYDYFFSCYCPWHLLLVEWDE